MTLSPQSDAVIERLLPSMLHPERGASISRAPIHRIGMRSLLPGTANHPEFDRRISPD
jgi:hypothetical protein